MAKFETLYLLLVQECEGADYRNIYFRKKRQMDATIELAKKDGFIMHNNDDIQKQEKIVVFQMRIFKMIKRIKNA